MCALESNYMLKFSPLVRNHVCATHFLRHRSRFVPSHAPGIANVASVHRCFKLSAGRVAATFLPKCSSQPGSDLDCSEPHVWWNWWNESRFLPFQKADCFASSVCTRTVLLEDKELARDLTHDGQWLFSQQHVTSQDRCFPRTHTCPRKPSVTCWKSNVQFRTLV